MKKVYIAKRIPKNSPAYLILDIKPSLTVKEIHSLYVKKVFINQKYIYNGPWILRPPISEEKFTENHLPIKLQPNHIWLMVKEKIENSNVFLGIVNSKSYGTIAETSYACKCKGIAVYALPDKDVNDEELQDLWFVFQMIKDTKNFWSDDDIKNITEFSDLGITSIKEYETFLETIIPNFMKK